MNQSQRLNNILLILGVGLLLVGLFGSSFSGLSINTNNLTTFEKPTNAQLIELAQPVTLALDNGGNDAVILANLYNDLATLISLDQDVIKNTEEIKTANSLTGYMLKLNMKDKYPNLAESSNKMVISYLGDDNAVLSPELRQKAVEVFKALAWACNEGAK
jgi:hypothetical protein